MLTSPDFLELLKIFKKNEVRFLVVDDYAVMMYTEPRFTKDLDLLIALDKNNPEKVFQALKSFGAPLKNLSADDFRKKGFFYQMGKAPLRIDILMSIPGVDFHKAWDSRKEIKIGDVHVPFIGREELIQAKRAAGRPQDLLDLKSLENQT